MYCFQTSPAGFMRKKEVLPSGKIAKNWIEPGCRFRLERTSRSRRFLGQTDTPKYKFERLVRSGQLSCEDR
jgi:hypothetical protein